jgi:heme A synthase
MMATWLAFAEQRRWLRNLGFLALAAVIAQGLLGGITVLFLLPTPVSVSHAVLAQSFLLLTIVIAYSLSRERSRREQHAVDAPVMLQRVSLVALVIIFLQPLLATLLPQPFVPQFKSVALPHQSHPLAEVGEFAQRGRQEHPAGTVQLHLGGVPNQQTL